MIFCERRAALQYDSVRTDFAYNPEHPESEYDNMIRVPATEFGKEIGRYQDMALNQPVVVTRNGRDRTVMISAEEYHRLKRRDRQVFATADASEEIVEAVRNSEMDPRHNPLDALLKDWTP
jgi:PHD/YefM family antitoxin component YafN of YafNO toxin-antitoxin module